jgi:hypothetical protein
MRNAFLFLFSFFLHILYIFYQSPYNFFVDVHQKLYIDPLLICQECCLDIIMLYVHPRSLPFVNSPLSLRICCPCISIYTKRVE